MNNLAYRPISSLQTFKWPYQSLLSDFINVNFTPDTRNRLLCSESDHSNIVIISVLVQQAWMLNIDRCSGSFYLYSHPLLPLWRRDWLAVGCSYLDPKRANATFWLETANLDMSAIYSKHHKISRLWIYSSKSRKWMLAPRKNEQLNRWQHIDEKLELYLTLN